MGGVLPPGLPGPVPTLVLWEGGQGCECVQTAAVSTLHVGREKFQGQRLGKDSGSN